MSYDDMPDFEEIEQDSIAAADIYDAPDIPDDYPDNAEQEYPEYFDADEPSGESEEDSQPALFKNIIISDGVERLVEAQNQPIGILVKRKTEPKERKTEEQEPMIEHDEPVTVEIPGPETLREDTAEDGSIEGETAFAASKAACAGHPEMRSLFDGLSAQDRADLVRMLGKAVSEYRVQGSEKVLNLYSEGLSFCIVPSTQDALSRMETENNLAAVMIIQERNCWNAVFITVSDDRISAEYEFIEKKMFAERRWKLVQQMAFRLFLRQSKR